MTDAEPTVPPAATDRPAISGSPIDLVAIERDLVDVELALARLESGDYWNDEVSGEPLPPELLAAHPTARRAAGSASVEPMIQPPAADEPPPSPMPPSQMPTFPMPTSGE